MADRESGEVIPPALYFNVMQIRHRQPEFFFEFGQVLTKDQQGGFVQVQLIGQPLVTSPVHAKQILKALQENIQRYEEKFGPIPQPTSVEPRKELG